MPRFHSTGLSRADVLPPRQDAPHGAVLTLRVYDHKGAVSGIHHLGRGAAVALEVDLVRRRATRNTGTETTR